MKTVMTQKIDNFNIVVGFGEAVLDPIETKKQGSSQYFQPKAGEYIISDSDYETLRNYVSTLEKNEVFAYQMGKIPDFTKEIIWQKVNEKWEQIKIDTLGIAPDENAILETDLTPEQKQEIEAQKESDKLLEMTEEQREEYLLYTKIIPEVDPLFNAVYRTNGKNYDGVMLQRFFEIFGQSGEIAYRNEFHNKDSFNPVSMTNLKMTDKELPQSNDKGFVYVDDITKDAEIIYDTEQELDKVVLGGLSTIMESGYDPMTGDIELSFIRGTTETPLTPLGKKPYTVFGYADLSGQSGTTKIKMKLKAGNATKKAVIVDIRVAG